VRELINGKDRGAPKKTGQAEQNRQTEKQSGAAWGDRAAQPARHDQQGSARRGEIKDPEEDHDEAFSCQLSAISYQLSAKRADRPTWINEIPI
jgi:hypothetical protein